MDPSATPLRVEGLEVFPEADGGVVHQSDRDKVHFLNHTALFVLELCNGRHSMVELGEIFARTFPEAADGAGDVRSIVDRFVAEELVRIP